MSIQLITRISMIMAGLGGIGLGIWGIYESSITVKENLIREGLTIRNDYSSYIKGLENFIPEEEITDIKWEEKCNYILSIRRWNFKYSEVFKDAKNFCTKPTPNNP